MNLPKLPRGGGARGQEVVAFRGLNRTENTQEGELRDASGLSTAAFPVLTQRGKRTALEGYAAPTDIFEWDGHLCVVDGGVLYYDGEAISGEEGIDPGKKQWAVVNTKLVIFPDKLYIDLTNNTLGRLDERARNTGRMSSSIVFTDHTITADSEPRVGRRTGTAFGYPADRAQPTVYTYGSDRAALEACFHDGAWDQEMLAGLEELSGFYMGHDRDSGVDGIVESGLLFIPGKSNGDYNYVDGFRSYTTPGNSYLPDKSEYLTSGYYAMFTTPRGSISAESASSYSWRFDLFKVGVATPSYSVFKVGDVVSVTGTLDGLNDVKHRTITGVDAENNVLTFAEGTFRAPIASVTLETEIAADTQTVLKYGTNYYTFTPTETIPEGTILYIREDGGTTVYAFRDGTDRGEYQATVSESHEGDYLAMSQYSTGLRIVTVSRDVPDLDFICESGNRLWGVSNRTDSEIYNAETGKIERFTARVIYASALGDPTAFWTFEGVDTDSYQVAVGSEGDFTGICAFGGGVCCWKEHRLHKILGSYPSEFYMHESIVEGVAAGSGRSLTVVNETLYYNGATGVYSYGGGVPTLIGYPLGMPLKDASGGTDGKRWYLSGTRRDGETELLVYDLVHRVWMREDDTGAAAFALVGGTLHMLADGVILLLEQGADDDLAWYAEFVPFTETATVNKYYLRLVLRLDMSEGSTVKIEMQEDGGAWRTALAQTARASVLKTAELPINRCDRFGVRISGIGKVTIRAMTREYIAGSERRGR